MYATVPNPTGLDIDPIGNLYCGRQSGGCCGSHRITWIPAGSAIGQDYSATAIADPDYVTFDSVGYASGVSGTVIVGSSNPSRLLGVRPDRSVFTIVSSTALGNPADMLIAQDGSVILTNEGGTLLRYDPATGVTVLNSSGAPLSISQAPDGLIYAGCVDGAIRVYEASGALLNDVFATGLGTSAPFVEVGPGGEWGADVYVIAPATGELRRYTGAGTYGVVGTGFTGFNDMKFGPDGALYLTDLVRSRIVRVGCRPSITSQPESESACIGTQVSLSILATGTGTLEFHWRHDANEIDVAENPSAATPTLVIDGLQAHDAGLYDCVVTNSCGSIVSDAATLSVVNLGDPGCEICVEGCPADFDGNGGVDGGDLGAFFNAYELGSGCADVDHNGGVDAGDIGYFIQVFEAGQC